MTMLRLSAIAHAAYIDLRTALVDETASEIIGSARLEKRGGKAYWYDMYRIGTAARILKTLHMPNGNLTRS